VHNTQYKSIKNYDFIHYCLDLFYDLGVRTIFTVPGGHIEYFLLEVAKDKRFNLVVSAHEEGAGFMADGYFRKSKQTAVVATINGPGATNLISAVSTARLDNSSIIFLTGDTPFSIKDKLGFQSSHQIGINTSLLFKNLLNKQVIPIDSNQLFDGISEYYIDFIEGNFYPLHINMHNDILQTEVSKSFKLVNMIKSNNQIFEIHEHEFNLNNSVMILGDDLINIKDIKLIVELCKLYSIPIVCTLGAKNIQAFVPSELFCGVYGYAGNSSAIQLVSDARIENVYFIETELNERNTMAWSHRLFQTKRNIYSISKIKKEDGILEIPIKYLQCSLESFTSSLLKSKDKSTISNYYWFNQYVYKPSVLNVSGSNEILSMQNCLGLMNKLIDKKSNFFLDSGDHRIYGSQYWDVREYNTFFTASKSAPMGWAIAAGIGATFFDNSIETWVLTGDGCMLMHGNELAVASRYDRNVKFIVINNGSYGRVELRLKDEESTIRNMISKLPYVNWVQYANSFDIQASRVSTIGEFELSLKLAQEINKPYLIEVMIELDNLEPKNESVFSSTASTFKPFWKED
jgi:acetolactate synthase-1/2/3 large subunit